MIKVWYWAITTLSTIGYGDLAPITAKEKITGCFLFLTGVSVFSFIMGQFIDILINYKSLWEVGSHKDLTKWIALLARFNNGLPLKKELITQIEDYMNYYWSNNRLNVITDHTGRRFMSELPLTI